MPYLTYEEYKEFSFTDLKEGEFKKLIKKASGVLDTITSFFYKYNDLEDDYPFRKEQFKLALGAQIEYFHEVGATTNEGVNSTPQSFSAGRTSVSNASSYKTTGKNEKKSIISEDALMYLSGTGLLYKGVAAR